MYSSATPTIANCDSQYVYDVAWTSNDERSTRCWSGSSIIEPRLRWKSMIHSPLAKARLTLWSAAPRATW